MLLLGGHDGAADFFILFFIAEPSEHGSIVGHLELYK